MRCFSNLINFWIPKIWDVYPGSWFLSWQTKNVFPWLSVLLYPFVTSSPCFLNGKLIQTSTIICVHLQYYVARCKLILLPGINCYLLQQKLHVKIVINIIHTWASNSKHLRHELHAWSSAWSHISCLCRRCSIAKKNFENKESIFYNHWMYWGNVKIVTRQQNQCEEQTQVSTGSDHTVEGTVMSAVYNA